MKLITFTPKTQKQKQKTFNIVSKGISVDPVNGNVFYFHANENDPHYLSSGKNERIAIRLTAEETLELFNYLTKIIN